jgi:hypothetical protein
LDYQKIGAIVVGSLFVILIAVYIAMSVLSLAKNKKSKDIDQSELEGGSEN